MSVPVIVVIRLSAMGDVALTLPVVKAAAKNGSHVLVVTRYPFSLFFSNIEGVELFVAETRGRHRGFGGILRLFNDVRRAYSVEQVIDLHNVIRSRILGLLFRLAGYRVSVIKKGRRDKRRFIRTKREVNLKNSVNRYIDAFSGAGINISPEEVPLFVISDDERNNADKILNDLALPGRKYIAIAPFARHDTKSWGISRMEELIEKISLHTEASFFLFGGVEDVEILESVSGKRTDTLLVAGSYDIRTELALLSKMDLMISMDSSNMHLAALSGIKTVSIWGGTHPATGFSPYGRQQHLMIQLPLSEVDCRPCTIYGSGGCRLDNEKFKCLTGISAGMVFDRIVAAGML